MPEGAIESDDEKNDKKKKYDPMDVDLSTPVIFCFSFLFIYLF